MCPDNIFANKRIVRLKIRAKYDINSKNIKNHANVIGSPLGIKIPKKFHLWYTTPIIFIAINTIKIT